MTVGRLYLIASTPPTVDTVSRTAHAVILPWGTVGRTSAGPTRFVRGSVRLSTPERVAWLTEHDRDRVNGYGLSVVDAPACLLASFYAPPGDAGDAALAAARTIRTGWSVGVDVITADRDRDGVLIVSDAVLRETSSVAVPAWDDARTILPAL